MNKIEGQKPFFSVGALFYLLIGLNSYGPISFSFYSSLWKMRVGMGDKSNCAFIEE